MISPGCSSWLWYDFWVRMRCVLVLVLVKLVLELEEVEVDCWNGGWEY